MTRLEKWKKQGSYKSIRTGEPMLLVIDKETGATILEPLYRTSKK